MGFWAGGVCFEEHLCFDVTTNQKLDFVLPDDDVAKEHKSSAPDPSDDVSDIHPNAIAKGSQESLISHAQSAGIGTCLT